MKTNGRKSSRIPSRIPSRNLGWIPGKRPGRVPGAHLLAALACAIAIALSGCESDIGKFDEGEVSQQAVSYMTEKYGEEFSVVSLWEDKSYSLFSYNSLDRVFCQMSDGSQVIVPIGEAAGEPLRDNKQAFKICEEVYDTAIAQAVAFGTAALERDGYTVSAACVNGLPVDQFDSSTVVSVYDWESESDDERSESAILKTGAQVPADQYDEWYARQFERETPFFHAKYDGDAKTFLEEEAKIVSFGIVDVQYVISGLDANYENGVPTDVPTAPRWQQPVSEAGTQLARLCGNRYSGYIEVYQTQPGEQAGDQGASFDRFTSYLGRLDCQGDKSSWLVIDWLYLGDGVWVTSNEPGVRLEDGDLLLSAEDVKPEFTMAEMRDYFRDDYPREFNEALFQQYRIEVDPEKARELAEQDEDIAKYRWFSAWIAYDNTNPECRLPEGVVAGELSPSLYQFEERGSGVVDADGNPKEYLRDFRGLKEDLMANGWQVGSLAVDLDVPVSYFRM